MCDEDTTCNSKLACSDLAHVVIVLVRRVTVVIVHIRLECVFFVMYFCVAIFVRELLYQDMFFLQTRSDPCVGVPIFIAKLSERQYCWRVIEDFHC